MKNTHFKYLKICIACAVLAIVLAAFLNGILPDGGKLQECPDVPKTGIWYALSPDGAVNADGSPWQARIRFGSENRLMLYFLGGGVSLDEYSAARSAGTAGDEGFYYECDDGISSRRVQNGIAGTSPENPFRDWTVLVIPYTTADFHAGAGAAEYTSLQGEDAIIHHSGYSNYAALIDMVQARLGSPDALLITGYSAGGFGAAMLADDVIGRFPDVENITVCVDGALLIHENWHDIAADRWHAPQFILERTVSDNLTLDHLEALHGKYADAVKILFTCSVRDGGLARYQAYIDGKSYVADEAAGDTQEENLREMICEMQRKIPDAGVYIWDGMPYADEPDLNLTRHTILTHNALFDAFSDETSIAAWIRDAVEGRVYSLGLELLQQ